MFRHRFPFDPPMVRTLGRDTFGRYMNKYTLETVSGKGQKVDPFSIGSNRLPKPKTFENYDLLARRCRL